MKIFREFPPLKKICYGREDLSTQNMESKHIKECEKKFFREYFSIHKQLVTGSENKVRNMKILNFFTQLKQLPKEYTTLEWKLTSDIPASEDIVADEDYWARRERFLPSLTEKNMHKVYEIKRELLSHSAVVLNVAKREPSQFPLLSYFEYDEKVPLYPEYSATLPYIELNPSATFSSTIRRKSLKPLPLENMFKTENPSFSKGSGAPNLFSYVKPDKVFNQQNASNMFSSELKRNIFNKSSTEQNEEALDENEDEKEKEIKDSTKKKIRELLKMVYGYWHKKKNERIVEDLRKIRAEFSKMLGNPAYGPYVDSINSGIKVIDKALNYV